MLEPKRGESEQNQGTLRGEGETAETRGFQHVGGLPNNEVVEGNLTMAPCY